MKKYIYIPLILILSSTLFSQGKMTFPKYIEDLQVRSPKKSIEWFKKNAYSEDYGVNEYVFDFYRGVNRYLSFVKFNAARTEVNRAASDFRQALELPNDPIYSYNDRAFLYIGGILTILPGDKELPARIFKYYADNCKTSNPYYATSIYWSMYLSYITPSVYKSYYETLKILENNPDNMVYDYFTGENKTISEMIKKLKSPENMVQRVYEWTTSNMDVYTLIKNSIPILPEEDGTVIYRDNTFIIFDRYSPTKEMLEIEKNTDNEPTDNDLNEELDTEQSRELEQLQNIARQSITPENASNRKVAAFATYTADDVVIDEPNIIKNKTNILIREAKYAYITNSSYVETKILYPLTIVINKNPNNGVIFLEIEEYSFSAEVSTNFIVELEKGAHEARISFEGKTYTNNINVEEDKYNLFSILIEDKVPDLTEDKESENINDEDIKNDIREELKNIDEENEENIEEDINKDTSLTLNEETNHINKTDNTKNIREIIKDVLSRPAKVATDWFNTNPYDEYMGISAEEYTYYRGVSYYSRFLNEGSKSVQFAAQAKSDLTFACNKKDNSSLFMKTRLYLGAVYLLAYNDLNEADKMFAEAGSNIDENHKYYPTVLYWRSRINVSDEVNNFIKILDSKDPNTEILDYSSTIFRKLSDLPSYKERIKGIKAVKNSKPLYEPPISDSKSEIAKTE